MYKFLGITALCLVSCCVLPARKYANSLAIYHNFLTKIVKPFRVDLLLGEREQRPEREAAAGAAAQLERVLLSGQEHLEGPEAQILRERACRLSQQRDPDGLQLEPQHIRSYAPVLRLLLLRRGAYKLLLSNRSSTQQSKSRVIMMKHAGWHALRSPVQAHQVSEHTVRGGGQRDVRGELSERHDRPGGL